VEIVIRVFKEMYEEGLGGLLEGQDGMALPAQANTILKLGCDEIRGNLTHLIMFHKSSI
jgi:hypothetical protein